MSIPRVAQRRLRALFRLTIAAAVLGATMFVVGGSASADTGSPLAVSAGALSPQVGAVAPTTRAIQTTSCHLSPTYLGNATGCKSSNQTLYLEMTSGIVEPGCESETTIEWGDGTVQRVFLLGGGAFYTITHTYSQITGAFSVLVVSLPISEDCIAASAPGEYLFFALAHTATFTTGPASSVASTSARLTGLLEANYAEMSDCRFEYGETTAYGSTIPCEGFGPGIWEVMEGTALIERLTPDTEYHFRIAGANEVGRSAGADRSFVTSPGIPVAVTGSTTEVKDTTAALGGSVNPEGSQLTSCTFEYGPTDAYGSSVPCSPGVEAIGAGLTAVPVAAHLTELEPDSEYHYRLVATNPNGTGTGSDATFTTEADVELQNLTLSQYDLRAHSVAPIPAGGKTVDGNQVMVSAKLENKSDVNQTVDIFLDDSYPDGATPLTFKEEDVDVMAHESRPVSFTLDTAGMSWLDGTAAGEQQVTVELSDGEEEEQGLIVIPKPVIFVHGWQLAESSSSAHEVWKSYLGSGGFLQRQNGYWEGFAIGDGQDGPSRAVMDTAAYKVGGNTIAQNAAQLATYIARIREKLDAHHVDIVAHSMGGLISREYVQNQPGPPPGDSRPVVDHLVMLGTPNKGSNCAVDLIAAAANPDTTVTVTRAVSQLLGAFADYERPVWTRIASNNPTRELTPQFVEGDFDKRVTQTRGTEFTAVAGTSLEHDYCTIGFPKEPNDSVVDEKSAWGVAAKDGTSSLLHWNFEGSADVFNRWVRPTLALDGTGAHGSGFRRAGLANALKRTGNSHIEGFAPGDRSASEPRRRDARRSPKVCLRPTTAPPVSAAYSLRLKAGGTGALRLHVPAGAGGLHVTVLGGPGLSLSLRDPSGRVVDEHQSEGAEAELVSLGTEAPRAGEWRLMGTAKGAPGPIAFMVGVQFDHPAAKLHASITTPRSTKGHHRKPRPGESEIRIHLGGLSKAPKRVTLKILPEGKPATTLSARQVPGKKDVYTVDSNLAKLAPALVSIGAATQVESISTLFELGATC